MYLVDPVYILYLLYFLLQGIIPLLLINKLVKVGKIKINENDGPLKYLLVVIIRKTN